MQTIRILALVLALAGISRAALPTIDTQPASATNCPGTTATFTVAASSDSSTNYQWYFNETNVIVDATNTAHVIASVSALDAGTYSVVVTNNDGAVTSIVALLVVNDPVTASGLSSVTVCAGSDASFSTTAGGTGPFAYVWRKNGGAALGSTSNSLDLVGVTAGDVGVYTVEVTGACGSVTNGAALTVNDLTVATGPANTAVCPLANVTLSTTASGAGPLSYVWRKDGGAALGSTSNSLDLVGVTAGDAGVYSVEVTGTCNSVTNAATLTVNTLVAATGPVSTNACVGTSTTFSTVASGSGPFAYQWSKTGTGDLVDATNASYTIASVVGGDAGEYCVRVTGPCDSVTNCATLTVTPAPIVTVSSATICPAGAAILGATHDATSPTFLWSPGGQTTEFVTNAPGVTTVYTVTVTDGVTGCSGQGSGTITVNLATTAGAIGNATNCPGTPVTFTTTAGGTGPFSYVWRKDGTSVQGPDANNTYTIASVVAGDAGVYSVEVTGTCNSATNSGNLVVVGLPLITAQPTAPRVPSAAGNGVVFTVAATTAAPLTYQWQTNGVNIDNGANVTGATSAALTISNLTLLQNGTIVSVAVSNCAGGLVSSSATLVVRAVHGLSFDLNTPGQWTNAPYELDPANINWVSYGAASTTVGGSPGGQAVISGGGAQLQMFQVSTGGVGVATGSGAVDFVFNSGTDVTALMLPVGYDFSLPGKTLTASVMIKLKVNTAGNNRSTQIGFGSATNYNNQWQGINGLDQHAWMSVILQAPGAAGTGLYGLRTQHKPIAGTAATEVSPPNTITNGAAGVNTTPGVLTGNTGTNGWYKLVARFVNTKTSAFANSFTVQATLQSMGPDGLTPGAFLLGYGVTNIVNADMVNQTNLYFMMRLAETGGINYWDDIFVTTTTGNIAFVVPVANASVNEGRTAVFKAQVDGDGPYNYQWFKNGVAIPDAGDWKYTTPRLLLADSGSEYSVTVTSTNNSVSSTGTVTVSASPLAVVSVGSVDGGVVGVRFSGPVDPTTATVAGNYLINGVPAIAAQMRAGQSGAFLSAKGQVTGQDVLITPDTILTAPYTVTVSGVTTLSGTALGASVSATGRVENLTGFDVDANASGFFVPSVVEVNANGAVGTYPGESFSFAPGNFELIAGGEDIFSTKDGFRFVYRQITGDFDIKERVTYQDTIRTPNKGGFNARISLDAFSPNVGAYGDAQPPGRNYIEGGARAIYGGAGISWGTNTACNYPNTWVRLRRVANTFIRYSSLDGVNWRCDGQINPGNVGGGFQWPSTLYVGIAANCNVGGGAVQIPNHVQIDGYDDFAGYPGSVVTISQQPQSITVAAGVSAVFTNVATATGGLPANGQAGEIAYIWQRTNSTAGGSAPTCPMLA